MSDRTSQSFIVDEDKPLIDWHAVSPTLDVRSLAGVALAVPLLLAAGVYWLHHAPAGTGSRVTDTVVEVRLINPQETVEQRQNMALQTMPPALQPQSAPLLDDINRSIPTDTAAPASKPEATLPKASTSAPASTAGPVRMPVDQLAATFQRALFSHIARYRLYPDEARRDRSQGTVQVLFAMRRDGTVADVWVKASSGNPTLDAAAADTIRKAQPLPKIPAGLPDRLNILMPVAFDLP